MSNNSQKSRPSRIPIASSSPDVAAASLPVFNSNPFADTPAHANQSHNHSTSFSISPTFGGSASGSSNGSGSSSGSVTPLISSGSGNALAQLLSKPSRHDSMEDPLSGGGGASARGGRPTNLNVNVNVNAGLSATTPSNRKQGPRQSDSVNSQHSASDNGNGSNGQFHSPSSAMHESVQQSFLDFDSIIEAQSAPKSPQIQRQKTAPAATSALPAASASASTSVSTSGASAQYAAAAGIKFDANANTARPAPSTVSNAAYKTMPASAFNNSSNSSAANSGANAIRQPTATQPSHAPSASISATTVTHNVHANSNASASKVHVQPQPSVTPPPSSSMPSSSSSSSASASVPKSSSGSGSGFSSSSNRLAYFSSHPLHIHDAVYGSAHTSALEHMLSWQRNADREKAKDKSLNQMNHSYACYREYLRGYLSFLFSLFSGKKPALVLDSHLSARLSILCGFKFLKNECALNVITTLTEEADAKPEHPHLKRTASQLDGRSPSVAQCVDCDVVYYIIRDSPISVRQVVAHATALRAIPSVIAAPPTPSASAGSAPPTPSHAAAPTSVPGSSRIFCLFLVPRLSDECIRELERNGAGGDDIFRCFSSFPLYATPLDGDLCSMEWPAAFAQSYLCSPVFPSLSSSSASGPSSLPSLNLTHSLAAFLFQLQQLYGVIPNIAAKGERSLEVKEALVRLTLSNTSSIAMSVSSNTAQSSSGVPSLNQLEAQLSSVSPSRISSVILIDRSCDLLTPLLTGLTYEGMLEETLGIRCGQTTLTTEMTAVTAQAQKRAGVSLAPSQMTRFRLSDADPLYSRIRYASFASVLSNMKKLVDDMRNKVSAGDEEKLREMDVHSLRQFTAAVPQLLKAKASVHTHVNIASAITAFTEDEDFVNTLKCEQELLEAVLSPGGAAVTFDKAIQYPLDLAARKKPINRTLRLLCIAYVLQSSSSGNAVMPNNEWQALLQAFLHCYGFQHMITLHQLAQSPLIKLTLPKPTTPAPWSALNKNFRLLSSAAPTTERIVSVEDSKRSPASVWLPQGESLEGGGGGDPQHQEFGSHPCLSLCSDMHYTFSYSAYAPLSVRILEMFLQNNSSWQVVDRCYPSHPSTVFSYATIPEYAALYTETFSVPKASSAVLIVFVGGISRAEISALHWLHRRVPQLFGGAALLLASDAIVNGTALIEHFSARS